MAKRGRPKNKDKARAKQIPAGYSEDEIITILYRVANRFAARFTFGANDIEDIKQQAVLEGWKGLSKYDSSYGGLETFLTVLVRNRLFNYKRDNYTRIDKPCDKCPIGQFDKENRVCKIYDVENLEDCKFYYDWILRNEARKNLVDTIEIDEVDDEHEARMHTHIDFAQDMDVKEIERILQDELPMKYWPDYDRFRQQSKLSKKRREEIQSIILEILARHGIENYE